jgi:O-antigen ligase
MESTFSTLNHGVIDYRKVFLFSVIFQLITLFVITYGNYLLTIGYVATILGILVIVFIPKEPVIGILLMLIATGLDFFGQIERKSYLFTFTYFHIFMVVTFISVFLNFFLRGKQTFFSCSVWAPFLAYNFVVALTLIYTPQIREGLMEIIRTLVLGGLLFAIIISVNTKARLKFVNWIYFLVPTGIAAYTIYQVMTEGAFYQAQVVKVATELGIPVFRSTGTFGNPNELAHFIMVGIIFGFGMLFVKNINIYIKTLVIMMIIIACIAQITTFSRGGWLATMTGMFFIIVLHRRWSYVLGFIGLITLAMIVLTFTHPEIMLSSFDRFLSIFQTSTEASASSRVSLIKSGIWMWQDHPFFGVGVGGFQYYCLQYMDPHMPLGLRNVSLPHTIEIKILSEEGILGLTLATWFIMTVIFHGYKSLTTIHDDFLKNMQITSVSLILAFIVAFTISSDMHNNVFYMTIGLIYAIPHVYQNSMKDDSIVSTDAV